MEALSVRGVHALFDLAGERLSDGRTIAPKRLLRCGFPGPAHSVSADRLRRSVTTVVDLRSPCEIAKRPGVMSGHPRTDLHQISVGGDATRPGFGACDSLVQLYPLLLDRYAVQVRTVVEIIAGAAGGTLVHCQTGRDRTGLVVGVALRLAGVTDEVILTRHREAAEQLTDYVAQRRLRWQRKGRDVQVFDAVNSHADQALCSAFDWIDDRFGGTAQYLAAHGADPDLPARLAATLERPGTAGSPAREGDRDDC